MKGSRAMNQAPVQEEEFSEKLGELCGRVSDFLRKRQVQGKPFGHFNLCEHAYAPDEVSAAAVGLELWKMLRLPCSGEEKEEARAYLQSFQRENGLIWDPSWKERAPVDCRALQEDGDSFFTRSVVAALSAWGMNLEKPIRYLEKEPPPSLLDKVEYARGGHHPFAIGDLAVLLEHQVALKVAGAEELQQSFIAAARGRQDEDSGLWVEPIEERGRIHQEDEDWTHHINRSFHVIKFTYNHVSEPLPYAERMIDTCLKARNDEKFYSWETGYACNELDLAHVLYSASYWTDHRREEVSQWARERLPMILAIQKKDGGFSFYHEGAQDRHFMLEISPGRDEGDLWGTLMCLGAIRMMAELAYEGIKVPWDFSIVHCVPGMMGINR